MPRRKGTEAACQINVRIPHDMNEEIRKIAAEENVSLATVVRELVRAQLNLPHPERDQLPFEEGSSAA